MLNNKLTLVTAAAALAQQVSGLSAHRHLHSELEARAIAAEKRVAELEQRGIVYETEIVVVTKTVQWNEVNNAAAPEPTVVEVPAAAAPPPAPATTLAKVVKPETSEKKPVVDVNIDAGVNTESTPEKEKSTSDSDSGSGSSSGASPFSSKRGVAYNDAQLAKVFGGACKNCGWKYNWASRNDGAGDNMNFVPMVWGDKPEFTDDWEKNAEECISQGSKALFSFNEPDIASQSNMSPAAAAQAYVKYMNKFSGKALLGAPAVSNSGEANQGLDWLQQFMDACDQQAEGCKIDFCNVHWYSEAEYADTLFEHLEKAHKICDNKPVWLTEFAPHGSDEAINSFMETVIPKLDKIEYLDAYSYFMVADGNLMAGTDQLSSYGKTYATI